MNSEKLSKALLFLDPWLAYRYKANEWPGFTVAISHKGKTIFNNSYGYANLERDEKLTPNHIFRIASHSKTFTAVAILQLAEENKITLSDPLTKYLPWLSLHKDKRFQKVTIKQVLAHNAGVIRDGIDSNFWLLAKPFPTAENFQDEILKADLVLSPGKKMKYSNYGFTLLGLVVESASGMSYNDYIIKHIVKPLGLENTGPEYISDIKSKLVTGYSRKDGEQRIPFPVEIDTKVMSAATGFYSTSEDLLIYFQALMEGSGKLLSDESKKLMQKGDVKIAKSSTEKKYGLGVITYQMGKHKLFGHGGGFPGQITTTVCDPKEELIITVLTSCIDGSALSFTKGIVSVLDYFENHYKLHTKLHLEKFEGIFQNIFAVSQITSMGNHLICVFPNVYSPFESTEKLKYIDNTKLKIGATNGFYSEGELVEYVFQENGKANHINYAGFKMTPDM